MKTLFILLLFSTQLFAVFEINHIEIECTGSQHCNRGIDAFKSLKRKFVDKDHFRKVIKVHSLTAGIQHLSYRVKEEGEDKTLFINWFPKNIISSVECIFDGESLSVPSILPVKEGDYYNTEKIEKVKSTLKSLYQSQGYPNMSSRVVEKVSSSGGVDLRFHIDLGKAIRVTKLVVVSKSTLLKKTVKQKLEHFITKPFSPQTVKKEIDDLESFFFNQGYFLHKLKFKYEVIDDEVSFFVTLSNMSIHAYSVRYKENDSFAFELKNKLKEATILSRRSLSLKRVREIVEGDTREKGYLNATINIYKKELKNIRGEPFTQIYVEISEKAKVKLKGIEFKGNNIISDRRLKSLYYKYASIQASEDVFDEKYYTQFLEFIREEYIKLGYVNVFLEPPEVELNSKENEVKLLYRIRERVRAKISKVKIHGVDGSLKKSIREILGQKVGEAFNPVAFKVSIEEIKKYLKENGYYFSELISEKVNKIITYNDDNTKVVIDLDFDLDKKYSIGEVIIIGNTKTRSKVIQRELLFSKSSILKASGIVVSQTRILSTGLFSSVNINPIKNSSSKADILISVKEKDYGLIELAPGVRTDLGPKLSAKVSYNNIDGLHKQLSFTGQINQRFNRNSLDNDRRKSEANLLEYLASVNYSENYFLDFPVSFDSSISTSRQRFFSFDANIQKINYTLSTDINSWFNVSLTQELETISQYNATIDRDDGNFQIGSITPSLTCLLYTSPSPRDKRQSRMPSSA